MLACATLLLASAPRHAAAAPESEAEGTSRTLERIHDPVTIGSASLLPVLATRDTSHLRLYRIAAGKPVAIPYQFDARDPRGELLVDAPAEIELDENDELVFMAKDVGDRATRRPCPANCDSVAEIEVADPLSGERGWVYLMSFATPPPRAAATPYARFNEGSGNASSASYAVEYERGHNFFTGLSVARGSRGSGENLIRQTRMHGSPTFNLLLTTFTLNFTEQNTIVEIDGVRAGPVRAVRRARLSVDLGKLFPELPSGTAYTYHYATTYLTPTRIKIPWIMIKTLRDFRFENLTEFRPEALPMRYFDREHPDGLELTKDQPVDHQFTGDHTWWAHSSAGGTVLHAFAIPPLWREWGVERGTLVRAGGEQPAAAIGYSLLNMTRLRKAGTYDLMQATVVLPRPFRAGDEAAPLAMIQSPLTTTVRRLR